MANNCIKMLDSISQFGNENKNDNEILSHLSYIGNYQKGRKVGNSSENMEKFELIHCW